jgi:hypothetical protein
MAYTLRFFLEGLASACPLATSTLRNGSLAACWGCCCRQDTLPLLVQPLELLSGLETEQGRNQSRRGSFACRFSIQELKSFEENNFVFKEKILKVLQLIFFAVVLFPARRHFERRLLMPTLSILPGKLVCEGTFCPLRKRKKRK